jgi:predicted nucleotidyltransferase
MIRYSRLPHNIEALIPQAISYLRSRKNIQFGYLFGSFAGKRLTPLSDVDIAVYLSEDADPAEEKLDILGNLMDCLQTDEVDLIILNKAPLSLKMKILESREVIVDNNPFLRHRYESLTMREYFDFAFLETRILERRYLNG